MLRAIVNEALKVKYYLYSPNVVLLANSLELEVAHRIWGVFETFLTTSTLCRYLQNKGHVCEESGQ